MNIHYENHKTESKRVVRLCCLSMNVIRETKIFFTTIRELTPDDGVSIRTSRTSRRFRNIHYGNHRNAMYHLFLWQPFKLVRCVSNGERLHRLHCFLEALVFHFINDFVRVARRYCLVIVGGCRGAVS